MRNPRPRIKAVLKQGPIDPEALDRAFAILWRIAAQAENSEQSAGRLDKIDPHATLPVGGPFEDRPS